jgi:hypothetical protein
MVKVLNFPLFPGVRVISIDQEPIHVASAGDLFLVVTKDGDGIFPR